MSKEGEKVVKEDWFKKTAGKGSNISTKITNKTGKKNGRRRYFVLTDRYLDWFVTPKGQRKGSVALDNIYVRQQTEKNSLVIGQYGRPKEFKMKYEGPNARQEVQKWYDSITLAIDDYKKKNWRMEVKILS